jgi:hypothetical protein
MLKFHAALILAVDKVIGKFHTLAIFLSKRIGGTRWMEGLMAREEEFLLLPGMKSTHFTD